MKKNYIINLLLVSVLLINSAKLGATDYYLKTGGGAITTLSQWGTNTDGTGTAPTTFTTAGDVWHFANRATVSLVSVNPAFSASATVVVENALNLTVSSAGVINASINISSGGTLTISNGNTFNLNSLNAASTVVFNSAAATVKAFNYGNVTIAASTSLTGAGSFNINGFLTLNTARTLTLNGKTLYINGSPSIVGTGSISADNAAIIALSGGNGGNNGTLLLASGGQTLNSLQTTYNTGTDYITLGSDLTIANSGLLFQTNGGIDLNGKVLTVDASSDASFPATSSDGEIRASGNSVISLNGTIGGNGGTTMFFNSTNNTLKSFTLNSNGSTLQMGSAINITDNLDVMDGTFDANGFTTLVASSSKTARLGQIGATGAITGNMTVQSFHSAGITDWTNLGANGVSGAFVGDWDGQIPITCVGCVNDPSVLSGFASVQGWDESTSSFITPMNASDPLVPGVGYWVFLGTGLASTTSQAWQFTGQVVQGATTTPISNGGAGADQGFNLVANPYASPISWAAVLAVGANGGFLADAIYIYNPNGSPQQSSYIGGISTGAANDIIPAGQGFFIENSFGAATLDFDETVKVSNNTSSNPLLRPAAKSNIGEYFKIELQLFNGEKDETAFRMHPDAGYTFDRKLDARKMFSSPGYIGYNGPYSDYTSISSKDATGYDYSIQSFPASSKRVKLPILVKVTATGTATLSAKELDTYNTSCIVIYDRYNQSYHDLKVAPYIVTLSDTTNTPRFDLVVCESGGATPLSIKELSTEGSVLISKDADGAFVTTNFDKNTKGSISVYNVIGQKIVNDMQIEGTQTTTRLNVGVENQVLIIKVTTDTETFTKKVVLN